VCRLVDLASGEDGVVLRVEGSAEATGLLILLGITEGARIRVGQRVPTYVIEVDGADVALERPVAEAVWVRRTPAA
jgi:Fe2+ transport system protein FeoA